MEDIIGYIIFVSYNRDKYDMKEIDLDDMSIKDFIEFSKNDEIECMTISVTPIHDYDNCIVGGSEIYDDSVYWYISPRLAKNETIGNFIKEYTKKI